MHRIKFFALIISVLWVGTLLMHGCSKKPEPVPVPESQTAVPEVLPELEQNKYVPPEPIPPPDYSFKESENSLEEVPEDLKPELGD